MDFYANAEKRKQQKGTELGGLIDRRYAATRAIEFNQKLIDELDINIASLQSAVKEIDQSQRDFNSYLAVKEGAIPIEDLVEGAASGEAVNIDQGAIDGGEIPEE